MVASTGHCPKHRTGHGIEGRLIDGLYRWFQQKAKVDPARVERATLGDVLLLAAAFGVTTLHKLVNGADSRPFSDDGLPVVPAPPWHADHRSRELGDDPVENLNMKVLQYAMPLNRAWSGRGLERCR